MSPLVHGVTMASPVPSNSNNNNVVSAPANNGPRKTVSEHRRCNKPIMEKKRRARINNCLDELKNLILDAMKKDPARHSKLEKADILEMTVKHLESLQRQQVAMTVSADPSVLNKYRAGFSECASEVGRFLGRGDAPPLDPHVKRRLLSHLTNCLNSVAVQGVEQPPPPSSTPAPAVVVDEPRMIRVQLPAGEDGKVMQLVPTCLPSGDIAFVLPQSARRDVALMATTVAANNSLSPTPPPSQETRERRAVRTAVVAPLSVALDLSISTLNLEKSKAAAVAVESPKTLSLCSTPPSSHTTEEAMDTKESSSDGGTGLMTSEDEEEKDVWRPW